MADLRTFSRPVSYSRPNLQGSPIQSRCVGSPSCAGLQQKCSLIWSETFLSQLLHNSGRTYSKENFHVNFSGQGKSSWKLSNFARITFFTLRRWCKDDADGPWPGLEAACGLEPRLKKSFRPPVFSRVSNFFWKPSIFDRANWPWSTGDS